MCHKQLPSKSTILTVVPQTSNVKTVASGSPVIPTCYGQHNKTGRQEEHCYLLGLVKKVHATTCNFLHIQTTAEMTEQLVLHVWFHLFVGLW